MAASLPAAANVDIVQNDPNNNTTSITVTVPQGTAGFLYSTGSRGDFYMRLDASQINLTQGILLGTIRNNGRDNGDGYGIRYGTVEVTTSIANYYGGSCCTSAWFAVNPAGNDNANGDELNVDLAAAYFPFSQGWSGGFAYNNSNNAEMSSFAGSADITLGGNFIDVASPTGTYQLSLKKNGGVDDVDARRDGLVFANGGKNENNFAAAAPSADGSHFVLEVRDNAAGGLENEGLSFLYLPYDTAGVAMGRVSGVGGLYNSAGQFTIRRESTGTFRLTVPGHDPTTGILLLTPDRTSTAGDNILSYQADGTDFLIEQRELDGAAPYLNNVGSNPAFSFAFIPFNSPPTSPGVRNFNSTSQVAAANLQIIEHASDDAAENLHVEVTEGTGYLTTPVWTRGDYAIYQNGVPVDATSGVMLATVRQNGRLNPTTAADTRYAMAATYDVGGDFWISTHWAGYPTWPGEFNVNVATAYFPFAAGWQAGRAFNSGNNLEMSSLIASPGIVLGTDFVDVAGGGGEYHLFLKKNGGVDPVDSRRDGLVFATGNKDENNFGAAGPSADGSRYVLRVHDSDWSGGENDPVAFVYLPFDTPNVISGRVTGYAGVLNGSGQFSIQRESAGTFRLTIPGESPTTGMLLLNSDAVTSTMGRIISYEADGSDFIIEQRSFSSNSVPAPWDAGNASAFSFAFIPFDNPPTAPGVRNFDPGSQLAAANIHVTEYGSADPSVNLHAEVVGSTGFLTTPLWTKGDYNIYQSGMPLDGNAGVLLSSIAQNGRDNGSGTAYATSSVVRDSSGYYSVATHEAGTAFTTTEFNIDNAAVYFPFAGGWQAGHAMNSTNGGPITSLTATPGISLGTEFIDNGNGQFYVRLPGVNALTDGLMFANHGKDENNYAMTRPATDGSEFIIHVHDNGLNGGGTEQDPVAFAYIPFGTPNLAMGRLNGVGSAILSQGEFSVRKSGTGTFELRIAGQDPTTGALLITGSATGVANDNIVSYEAAGDHWVIETRDLIPPTLQNMGASDGLVEFAFIPFDSPPTAPVARPTYDANRIGAANIHVTEFTPNNGTDNGDMYAQVVEGSAGIGVYSNNLGDVWLALRGGAMSDSDGVLLATVREHERDNSATGGKSGYGMVATDHGYARLHWAVNAGWAEENIDFAVALFPSGAGFSTGQNVATSGSSTVVSILDSGDTRRSGVLIGNVYGNLDSFTTVQPVADGSGWNVQTRYKDGGSPNSQPVNYAFLPYGTENLVAGQVTETGYLTNRSGDFTLVREGTGLYRLNIAGESPQTGMLLLTATQGGSSSDNLVVYRADGDDFLIQGLDAGNSTSGSMPQDTYFNFAFVGFDNPPQNPQLRAYDPGAAVAGNIRMIENDTGNNPTSVSTYTTQATPGLTVHTANRGDVNVSYEGLPIAPSQGVTFATIRNNVRDNGTGNTWATANVNITPSNLDAETWVAINQVGNNAETNVDTAVAMFPFEGGWLGAHVDASGTILASSPHLSQSMVSRSSTGRYQISLPGVDSRSDGYLFAIRGVNEGGAITAAVRPDGGGWELGSYRYDGNFGTYSDDPFSFLYLPVESFGGLNVDGLVAGRVDDDGSLFASSGDLQLTRLSTGAYQLEVFGETPETGMLLLTVSKLNGSTPEDNFLTYEASGDYFIIHSHDMGNGHVQALQDTEFTFAFISFDAPLTSVPEPSSLTLLASAFLAFGVYWRRRSRQMVLRKSA